MTNQDETTIESPTNKNDLKRKGKYIWNNGGEGSDT